MLADLHCHTRRCGHADGDVADYVAGALGAGLEVVGIADHLPFVDRVDPTLTMGAEELPGYVREVHEAAAGAPGDIEVLLGIEADFVPGTEGDVARLLDQQPFDYVLGSVHVLGDWLFDHPDHRDRYREVHPDEFWEEYLTTVRMAVETGLFDVLAHADLAKKFDVRPTRAPLDLYEGVAEAMARSGVAVEVNTSGLYKPVGEIYPERSLLERCRAHGVSMTLGSDAHSPAHVGRAFAEGVALVRSVGYREAVLFRERVPEAYQLPEPGEVGTVGG